MTRIEPRYINFVSAALVGCKGYPIAIGREHGEDLIKIALQERNWLIRIVQRNSPRLILFARTNFVIENEASVCRPRNLEGVGSQDKPVLASASGRGFVQFSGAAGALRRVKRLDGCIDDAGSVWQPNRTE